MIKRSLSQEFKVDSTFENQLILPTTLIEYMGETSK